MLQNSFDTGYAISYDHIKKLGIMRGSLAVALISADQSESLCLVQKLRQLDAKAKNIEREMIDVLKKDSSVEEFQKQVNKFQLEEFALQVQETIKRQQKPK